MVVIILTAVFWDLILCTYQHFRGMYYLNLQAVCPFEMFVTFHQPTSASQKTLVLISELWIIVFQIISMYYS
jgi:hypothetical protein